MFLALYVMALTPARAIGPMAFPLICQPGQNCWIIGYPDLNGDRGQAQDYMCGPGAKDGDVFIRFGLPDISLIPLNIPIVAIEDGKVADATDGIPDMVASSKAQIKAGTLACGNGVVIDHGGGMQSVYCHMRKDSVRVKTGEQVHKGQIIGTVGQSGIAFWPQLGFSIRDGGFFVDPITGTTVAEGCGSKPHPVMDIPAEFLKYQPASIVALGFSNAPVEPQLMATGQAPRFAVLNAEEKTINLWTMILGVRKDDVLEIRLRDPRGRTFYYSEINADADAERMPLNVSRDRGYVNWRAGTYTGTITVTRKIGVAPYSVTRAVSLNVE